MISSILPTASSVLVVCAHPDDESFGLGGILTALIRQGARTAVLCFTHGEASTLHGGQGDLATVRPQEFARAARNPPMDLEPLTAERRRQQTRDYLLQAAAQVFSERLRTTLEDSEVPPEARLLDFVALIREGTRQAGSNFGVLYEEFWLYAVRNPTAREQLSRLENENVRAIAQIIESERRRGGSRRWSRPSAQRESSLCSFTGSGCSEYSSPTWWTMRSSRRRFPSSRAGWE